MSETIDLPGLIKRHGLPDVATAAGVSIHTLRKLRNHNPGHAPNRRTLTEHHLRAWLALDPAFSAELELARRAKR